jgi:hypothetical protein
MRTRTHTHTRTHKHTHTYTQKSTRTHSHSSHASSSRWGGRQPPLARRHLHSRKYHKHTNTSTCKHIHSHSHETYTHPTQAAAGGGPPTPPGTQAHPDPHTLMLLIPDMLRLTLLRQCGRCIASCQPHPFQNYRLFLRCRSQGSPHRGTQEG